MGTCILPITALLLSVPASARADTAREIAVRTDSAIHVDQRESRGRIYTGHIALDVLWGTENAVAIPQGSPVELIVRETGPGEMTVDIQSITVKGRRYVIDTEWDAQDGSAIVGANPGVVANGQDIQPQGAEIHIPSETVLRFQQPSLILLPACRGCM